MNNCAICHDFWGISARRIWFAHTYILLHWSDCRVIGTSLKKLLLRTSSPRSQLMNASWYSIMLLLVKRLWTGESVDEILWAKCKRISVLYEKFFTDVYFILLVHIFLFTDGLSNLKGPINVFIHIPWLCYQFSCMQHYHPITDLKHPMTFFSPFTLIDILVIGMYRKTIMLVYQRYC